MVFFLFFFFFFLVVSLSDFGIWPMLSGTGAGSWATSGSTARNKVSRPSTQGMSRCGSSLVLWQMVLVAGPRSNSAVAESIGNSTVSRWAQTCLLKMALFVLGLHQSFATSYLDPKAPIRHLCL